MLSDVGLRPVITAQARGRSGLPEYGLDDARNPWNGALGCLLSDLLFDTAAFYGEPDFARAYSHGWTDRTHRRLWLYIVIDCGRRMGSGGSFDGVKRSGRPWPPLLLVNATFFRIHLNSVGHHISDALGGPCRYPDVALRHI